MRGGLQQFGGTCFLRSAGLSEQALDERAALTAEGQATEAELGQYTKLRLCRSQDLVFGVCQAWREINGSVSVGLDFDDNGWIDTQPVPADLDGTGSATDAFSGVPDDWNRLRFDGGNIIGNPRPRPRRDISPPTTCMPEPLER